MRICIDARNVKDEVTGVGRYALNLVRHVVREGDGHDFLLLRNAAHPGPLVERANVSERVVSHEISSVRNVVAGAPLIDGIDADLYHSLFHMLPLGSRRSGVVLTLHDLIWVEHPELAYHRPLHRWFTRLVSGRLIDHAVPRADHVIAIPHATADAARRRYDLAPEGVTVIGHGVDPAFVDAEPPPRQELPGAVRERPFVLSLGHSKPYKNVDRLIRAFAAVVSRHPEIVLLVAGRGEGYPRLSRLVDDLELGGRVRFSGPLEQRQLLACYAHARFLAFPSLIEGFGLPVIEAMACGCPVLTSDVPPISRTAGGAALTVAPTEVEAIARGIDELLADAGLRRRLAAAGLERSRRFRWEDAARRTLDVYRRVADDPG